MRSVFVSSTFKDMQYERDMLQTIVDPQLNATAVRYADSVFFSDLRWGISTGDLDSETGSRKILSVCLGEIERCRPYMLVFVGERYGWIPDPALIRRASDEKGFRPDDYDISVTSLEIEFGALKNADYLSRCLFCFRKPLPVDQMSPAARAVYDSEDEDHRRRIEALKEKIRRTPGANILEYQAEWDPQTESVTGLSDLADRLTNEFLAMFSPEWEQQQGSSWQEIEENRMRSFANTKTSPVLLRPDIHSAVLSELEEKACPVFVRGNSGTGKTVMMCQLAGRLQQSGEACLILCGNSDHMLDITDILRYMICQLEKRLGISPENAGETKSFAQYRREFEALCGRYEAEAAVPLTFVIDALDQLSDDPESVLSWLPEQTFRKVRFLFSALEDYALPVAVRSRSAEILLKPLDDAAKHAVIDALLKQERKEIAPEVYDAMLASPASDNPLYLSLLVRRLVMFDHEDFSEIARLGNDMAAITTHMLEIIRTCPSDLQELCCRIAEEAGARIHPQIAEYTLGLIAASRFGMRESDIAAICTAKGIDWNTLDFSRVIKYLQPFLMERTDGRFDFLHKSFREGIRGEDAAKHRQYDQDIYDRLCSLADTDTVRQSEIIYHMFRVDNKNALTDLLWNCCALGSNIERETKELHLLCIEYGPEWLISVIRTDYSRERGSWFFAFFSTVFCNAFRDTYLEQECLLKILLAVEEAAAGSSGFQSAEVQGTIEYQIAQIYGSIMEDDAAADRYYEQAYRHLKESGEWQFDLPVRANLGIICNALAAHASSEDDLKRAEHYLQEANELYQDREGHFGRSSELKNLLAENELSYARILTSGNDPDNAAKHLESARTCMRELIDMGGQPSDTFVLRADQCEARISTLTGDYANAYRIFSSQEAQIRARYDEQRDLSARSELQQALMSLASVCSLTGQGKEASEYVKEATGQAKLLNAEVRTAHSAREYIRVLYRAARLTAPFDPQQSAGYADSAVREATELVERYDNRESLSTLAHALRVKADLAENAKDWDTARESADRAAELMRQAAELGSSAQWENQILYCEVVSLGAEFGAERMEQACRKYEQMLKRARDQMLAYPGSFSLNLYDEIVTMPLAYPAGWEMGAPLEEVLQQEIRLAEDTDITDENTAIQVVGECQGACYEVLGRINLRQGEETMGGAYLSMAQKYFQDTFDETGVLYFEDRAQQVNEILGNHYHVTGNLMMAIFYQQKYVSYLIEKADTIDTYEDRIRRAKELAALAQMLKDQGSVPVTAIQYAGQVLETLKELPEYHQHRFDALVARADANSIIGEGFYNAGHKIVAQPYFTKVLEDMKEAREKGDFPDRQEERVFLSNFANACFLTGAVESPETRRPYFEQGRDLLLELLREDPDNEVYRNNYDWVENVLAHI